MLERGAREAERAPAEPVAEHGAVGLAFAVFFVVVFIGYSDTIIFGANDLASAAAPGWLLPVVDSALLVLLAWLVWRRAAVEALGKQRRLVGAGIAGAALLLGLDCLYVWAPEVVEPIGIDLVCQFGWVVAMAILLAAALGAEPRALIGRAPAEVRADAWRRFRFAIPLLVGTFAGYVASVLWDRELLKRRVTEGCDTACSGAVDQEFFAQACQVILLLVVAIALEAALFRRLARDAVGRALVGVAILILLVGEALAISALPRANKGVADDILSQWHEYVAFFTSVQAIFTGLATLALAVVFAARRAE